MAKKQTFGDKMKKGAGADGIRVKVIQGYRTEKGSVKYYERFVNVEDVSKVDKIDLTEGK